jgi:prevent-host-death family protein
MGGDCMSKGCSVLNSNRADRMDAVFTVTATDAKNQFGRVLEKAIQGGIVVITKHDEPKAVLISVREFNALKNAGRMKLDALSGEFDALLARMAGTGRPHRDEGRLRCVPKADGTRGGSTGAQAWLTHPATSLSWQKQMALGKAASPAQCS